MTCASCGPGHRWLAIAIRLERSLNRVYWTRYAGHDLARLLPGTPVRCFVENGRLVHPRPEPALVDALAGGHVLGVVERAWVGRGAVHAVLHLADDTAEHVQRAWLKAERRRQLFASVGLSVSAEASGYAIRDVDGQPSTQIDTVRTLHGLDVVSRPAAHGGVLRSLPPTSAVPTDLHAHPHTEEHTPCLS